MDYVGYKDNWGRNKLSSWCIFATRNAVQLQLGKFHCNIVLHNIAVKQFVHFLSTHC